MIVKSITRPRVMNLVTDMTAGEFDSTIHDVGMEHHFEETYGNGLIIAIDVHDDGTKIVNRGIRFTDYTGLQQEWSDGTSATILDATLQIVVNAVGDQQSLADSTNPSLPNSYQRAQVVNKSYTPSFS